MWIQDNVIKDESIWEMKPRQNHTWLFKKILGERETILQWIRMSPGDCTNVKFWLDPWTKFGQLITFFGRNGPRQTRISLFSTVAELWTNGEWCFRPARSQQMEELQSYLTTILLSTEPSSLHRFINNRPHQSFSSSTIYHSFDQFQTVA